MELYLIFGKEVKMLTSLFIYFLEIGVLSFGGGYAVLSLIQSIIVDKYSIITPEQFLDLVAISQISPGPIAINASTFVGFMTYGLWGATVTTFAIFILPFILAYLVSRLYNNAEEGILKNILESTRLCVAPIILIAVVKLYKISIVDFKSYLIIAIILGLYLFNKKISPIILIIIGGALGYIFYAFI